jgi:DNA-binding NtrC family response regulator
MKEFTASDAIILLLDSDLASRGVLREAIESANYLVITAEDLGSAVDRLQELHPDLLITRPYINSMPGRMAAHYLRTKHPGLPVLIVAGFMEDDRLQNPNEIEGFHTFPKPFTRDQLLGNLRSLLKTIRHRT